MLFYEKVQQKEDFMSGQASETNMFTKEAVVVPPKSKERDTNVNVSRNSSSSSKRLSLSLPKKRKAVSPNKTHTCSDENQISMSTAVGRAPVSFSSKTPVTAELKKRNHHTLHDPHSPPHLQILISPCHR